MPGADFGSAPSLTIANGTCASPGEYIGRKTSDNSQNTTASLKCVAILSLFVIARLPPLAVRSDGFHER